MNLKVNLCYKIKTAAFNNMIDSLQIFRYNLGLINSENIAILVALCFKFYLT